MDYRKFPQIDYDHADAGLRAVYDDIMGTVRVPWVAFTIRVLATFPGYVQAAWHKTRENFATQYFEEAGKEVRALAALPGTPPVELRSELKAEGWTDSKLDLVTNVVEALAYGNPKYCVLITAWAEAFQGRLCDGGDSRGESDPLPYGIRDGLEPLQLVDPEIAPADIQALLARIRDDHWWHDVASDYRALAQWPEFLSTAYDSALAPVVRTQEYDAVARSLLAKSRELAAGLPGRPGITADEVGADLSDRDIASLTGILTLFQRFVMDITIDMVRLRDVLDSSAAGDMA